MHPSPTFEDEFINVWAPPVHGLPLPGHHPDKKPKDFYTEWYNHASAPQSIPEMIGTEALQKLYPSHSVVISEGLNAVNFPSAQATPLEQTPLITNVFFMPLARKSGIPGLLIDQIAFGSFKVVWKEYEFIQHTISFPVPYGIRSLSFFLHDGPEAVIRLLLSTIGAWQFDLHEEIWVFDRGFWTKEHGLWQEIQKADWKDVILKEEFKKELQKDVYGFFKSEAIYKQLAIPWKRGLIMHGPPGNGKTISLKAIMKTCEAKGFLPLYVKSFQSWMGEEAAMTAVFNKARSLSPCVVILEDLDSLINNQNRSFFLNQMDGLESNDGLLIVGTTNHFDRLDPGLSTRPSRFDRKYLFDDPDLFERKLYAQYWQKKLSSNKDIDFPDSLVEDFAGWTDRFSFAYLKEAFVSSLVLLAGIEDDDKLTFKKVLKSQVDVLRKQLDKTSLSYKASSDPGDTNLTSQPFKIPQHQAQENDRDFRVIMDSLSEYINKTDFGTDQPKFYRSATSPSPPSRDAEMTDAERKVRRLFDSLSQSLEQASDQRTYTNRYSHAFPSPPRHVSFGQQAARHGARPEEVHKWLSGLATGLNGYIEPASDEGKRFYAHNTHKWGGDDVPAVNIEGANGVRMPLPKSGDLV